MPELPEVESVRRQLHPQLAGRRIVSVEAIPQARFGDLTGAAGRRLTGVRRRGKYLLAGLVPPETSTARERHGRAADHESDGHAAAHRPNGRAVAHELVMHLGMTGSLHFRGADGWVPDAYVRATFTLEDGVLDFRDVRRFGQLTVVPAGEYGRIATLAGLGPEPLSDAFTPAGLYAALAATRMAVKPFLLTQRPVAGVGNIYADEALWRARINPRARRVGPERAERLWAAIREVLSEAVEHEGTTFRNYRLVNGQTGRFAESLAAYGRAGQPCRRCGTPLVQVVVGGRGTTYCRRCQRR